ncbi:hypothetical protein SAMN05720354_11859 [Nitrosospira sp. Nsp1]|nr:hypothetical protein SAMN05720354_11859 [Nitrosospira sp. Nsp1]
MFSSLLPLQTRIRVCSGTVLRLFLRRLHVEITRNQRKPDNFAFADSTSSPFLIFVSVYAI